MLERLKKHKMSEVSVGILKGPFAVRLLDSFDRIFPHWRGINFKSD